MMSDTACSCSDTVSVQESDDGKRDIPISRRKIQALDSKR